LKLLPWAVALLLLGGALFNFSALSKTGHHKKHRETNGERLIREGKQTFRFDTFGDEQFWTNALHLEKAIEGSKHGGVGPGLSPKAALGAGLKVDVNALPRPVLKALKKGKVDLNDPATTLALLKLNAVVGLKAKLNHAGSEIRSVGITCAVCHSTVNNSVAPGVGQRLDGWPNRDLNVGAIISLAPNKKPITDVLGVDEATVGKVLAAWGPGKFDAELFLDGKGFRPDGGSAATLIPPAFGLAGVNLHTFTGWGSIPYWNAFVANLEMHGQGNFSDSRLDDPNKFPVAARNGFGHVRSQRDLISSKLPGLQAYQLSIAAPKPPKRSFSAAAAKRGKAVFDGQGKCATCHVPPTFSEPGFNMHKPAEICTDAFQADRSPDGMYRTTPLRGLWAHQKGGFYHDGRFKNLGDVVSHYDSCFNLQLSPGQKQDLVQYLKSL
jgi:mono/diheme cytochrome c family protein